MSQMQSGAGLQDLRNQLLQFQAQHPTESYLANIPAMQKMAQEEATLNAANSKILEKTLSPETAAIREQLPKSILEDLQRTSSPDATNAYKQQQMASLFSGGLQNMPIGNAAYADQNTILGQKLRQQAEQAAASYLQQNQAPVAGIDPGALVNAQNASQAQAVQNRNAFLQNMISGAGSGVKSMSDWINTVMGNQSQAVGAHQQNWQNYQQAMYNAAAQNAASQNATTGALLSAAGTIGGAVIGGPVGAAIGGALGSAIGPKSAPVSNYSSGGNYTSSAFNPSTYTNFAPENTTYNEPNLSPGGREFYGWRPEYQYYGGANQLQ